MENSIIMSKNPADSPPPLMTMTDDHFHVESDNSQLLTRRSFLPEADRDDGSHDDGHVLGTTIKQDAEHAHHHSPECHRRVCHTKRQFPTDKTARNQLIVASALTTLFMTAEIVGGVLSNSLALVADAAHMASDLTGFLVSLFAVWLATKPPTARVTFGYHRAEVIGATLSILIIWIVTGILVYLGVRRLVDNHYDIQPNTMLITAGIGVAFNIVMAIVLHGGIYKKCRLPASFGHNHSHAHGHDHAAHHHGNDVHDNGHHPSGSTAESPRAMSQFSTADQEQAGMENGYVQFSDSIAKTSNVSTFKRNINIRAATLHVLGDLIQSIGVLIAAVVIKIKPEYKMADPICTFVFSALVLVTTITILRDIIIIIMEAVPGDVNTDAIKKDLTDIEGVKSVHSLHLWALTISKTAATVHLAVRHETITHQQILNAAGNILRDRYHVMYPTIQIEEYDDVMSMCVDCNR